MKHLITEPLNSAELLVAYEIFLFLWQDFFFCTAECGICLPANLVSMCVVYLLFVPGNSENNHFFKIIISFERQNSNMKNEHLIKYIRLLKTILKHLKTLTY